MFLKKIVCFEFKRPFKLPFKSPHTSRTSADSIVVQLVFENGISGYGESAPRAYVTGEDCSTVVQIIEDVFTPPLFSHPITCLQDIEKLLNHLEQECLKRSESHYTSALGAIDIALLDALGKSQRLPVASYLGSIQKNIAPRSISLPLVPLDKIEGLFSRHRELDFKHLKILVGQDEKENLDRVLLLRKLFGKDVDLRLEANGRWNFDQAVSNLEMLINCNISAVEEPLPMGDIEGFHKLKKMFKLNIILDESMCSLSDAEAIIDAEACNVFNIKISKCGGLIRSKAIAEFAESRGIACYLGCHVGESEILGQAAKHFSITRPDLLYIEGYTMLLFEDLKEIEQKGIGWENFNEARNCQGLGLNQAKVKLRDEWLVPLAEFES